MRDYAVGCEWAEGVNWADRWTTDGRPDRQTDTQKWQMDKELPLNGNPPPSQLAGFLCTKQELWPSLARCSCARCAYCGVGTRSPTLTPVADGLCCSLRPSPPQSMSRYSFIPLSRERQLCKFLALGNYAIVCHHCDLNL